MESGSTAAGDARAQALLAHVGWMRELAQALLRDPAAAEDVVQDSLIKAWRRGPDDSRSLAPWLARVVRNSVFNRVRGVRRRERHEARSDGPRPEASPPETAERLELQRRVLEAVASIDEPLRTTLVLRYFEGRTSAEIAQLQGVPAGTVRWRLTRALDALRERLDERHGPRTAWSALLAPIAHLPEPATAAAGAAATSGVLLMSLASKWVLSLVALSLAGAVWWMVRDAESGVATEGVAASVQVEARSAPADAPAAPPKLDSAHAERASVEVDSPRPAEVAPAPAAASEEVIASRIAARFVDEHGAPWSAVEVTLAPRAAFSKLATVRAVSDLDGRAELVWMLAPGGYRAAYRISARRSGCASVALTGVIEPGAETTLGDIVLGPAARIVGRVVDERGAPLPEITVGLSSDPLNEADLEFLARHGDEEQFRAAPTERSGAAGEFELNAKPGRWRVWGHAEGRRYGWSEPLEVRADAPQLDELVLTVPLLRATDTLTGRVVTPSGAPAPLASLFVHYLGGSRAGSYFASADSEGRFELLLLSDGRYSIRARDVAERYEDGVVLNLQSGARDVEVRLAERDEIELSVRDSEGRALENVVVEAHALDAESGLALDAGLRTVDAKLVIHRPTVAFSLSVGAPGFVSQQRSFDAPQAAPPSQEFELERKPVLRGRVVVAGAPQSGLLVARMQAVEESTYVRDGYPCRWMHSSTSSTTASDGSFEVELEGSERWYVRIDGGKRFAAAIVGPFDAARVPSEPLDVELDEGGAIEGVVRDSSGALLEGAIVGAHCGDGAPRTLRSGAGGLYRFERLTPGDWQVRLRDEELRSDQSTTMSGAPAQPIEWNCQVRRERVTRVDLSAPAAVGGD